MPAEKRKADKNAPQGKNKRKTPGFVCGCDDESHETLIECEREKKLELHQSIADRICPWSEKVSIFVGTDKQIFHVEKSLLRLHSGYFRDKFQDLGEGRDRKQLFLPSVDPGLFAEFVCWLKSGYFIDVKASIIHIDSVPVGEKLWELGHSLRAPGFQNFAIDDCRTYCQDPENPWPILGVVKLVYQITARDSKLRKFAAHSVARKNPFDVYEEGDPNYDAWSNLLEEFPDLGLEMARVAGKKWDGTYPWDDEHRAMYLEEEVPLDQVWEEQILADRDINEIKEAAKERCIRSIVELDHLNRNEGEN